jgi:hypothetical protein
MKYLYNRTQFKRINEYYAPIENDINWGDSILGRMMYAFIRTTKINLKTKKVDGLLKELRKSLDLLLAESLSRDDRNKFIILSIKYLLSDVDNICNSSETEEQKLEKLLGSSNPDDLWDPNNPNKGNWMDSIPDNLSRNGLLIKTHEFIRTKIDKEHLKSFVLNKDELLNIITDLIDQLREYSYLSSQGPVTNVASNSFPIAFSKLIKKNLPALVADNYQIKQYDYFIKENKSEEDKKSLINILVYLNKLIPNISNIKYINYEKIYSNVRKKLNLKESNINAIYEDDFTNQIINIFNLVKDIDINVIDKKQEDIKKLKAEFEASLSVNKNSNSFKNAITIIISLAEYIKTKDNKQAEPQQKQNTESTNVKDLVTKISNIKDDKEINNFVDKIDLENKKAILNKIISSEKIDNKDKEEAKSLLNQLIDNKNKVEAKKENISINKKYNKFAIFESAGDPLTVKSIWDRWCNSNKIQENQLNIISQNEIEEFNFMDSGQKGKQQLQFNPKVTPDPIIQIARIFKRAHDLYFTETIPSIRTDGKVSNITRRKYELLGSRENEGPWAVKSIRNKWVDGVMEILEDQQYRKIFANVDFVVPGSEDVFSESKIYEKEEVIKSHGNILFDFINGLLSKETTADFDKQRASLLKKYFGNIIELEGKSKSGGSSSGSTSTPTTSGPSTGGSGSKTLMWKEVKDVSSININNGTSENPFLQISFTDNGSTETIKFHIIKQGNMDKNSNKHVYYDVLFFKEDNTIIATHKINLQKDNTINKTNGFVPTDNEKYSPGRIAVKSSSLGVAIDKTNIVSNKQIEVAYYDGLKTRIDGGSFTITSSQILYEKDGTTEKQINKDVNITDYVNVKDNHKTDLNTKIQNLL